MGLHQQPLALPACLIISYIVCQTSGTSTVSVIGSTTTSDDIPTTSSNTQTSTTVNDLVCYGCSDTQRGGDCQTNTRDMRGEAMNHLGLQGNKQPSYNYVKRCSGYSNFSYCVIETIENRGEVHSYIRDCSDGVSFSYPSGKLSNLPADNQTTCAYTGQGYVICIRLCRTSFCNGPDTMSAADTLRNSLVFFMFVTFCMVLVR